MGEDKIIGPPETREEIIGVAESFAQEVQANERLSFAAWTLEPVPQGGRAAKLFFHASGFDLLAVGADALQEASKAITALDCGCERCAIRLEAIATALDALGDAVSFGGTEPPRVQH